MRRRILPRRLGSLALLVIVGAVVLGPLSAMVTTAFTRPTQFARQGIGLPAPWTSENFAALLSDPDVLIRPALITLAVAGILATVQTVTAVLAAYVFIRLPFRGSRVLLALYVGSYLAPPVVTFLPLYVVFARVGLIGTFWVLFVPFALASPYAILLLVQSFRSIPSEILDAAELDGASHGSVLRRIVLPLTLPTVGIVVLVSAVSAWNSYLWPRLASGVAFPQIQVAIGALQSQYDSNWTLVMAGTTLAVVPPLLAAAVIQRHLWRPAESSAWTA